MAVGTGAASDPQDAAMVVAQGVNDEEDLDEDRSLERQRSAQINQLVAATAVLAMNLAQVQIAVDPVRGSGLVMP